MLSNRRYRIYLCAIVMLLGASPSILSAQPQYSVIELEPLPGLFPIATTHDIGPSGHAVGRTWKNEGSQNQHHAVLWAPDGSATDIGDDGFWSEGRGISATGFIAGRHDLQAGVRGALWSPAMERTLLPPLAGGIGSEAWGVDDAGVAVGVSISAVGDRTAVRWRNGVPQALPGASEESYAFASNGAGQAVGRRDVFTARQALLWSGQDFTILPDLGGDLSSARNISESGIVCGGSADPQGRLHAVLWAAGTHEITILPTPQGGVFSQVEDVNSAGDAVGFVCATIDCDFPSQRAIVWIDGMPTHLNEQIPPGSGWVLFAASAINDAGEIVGIGAREGFPSVRAFKLIPETSSVSAPQLTFSSLRVAPNPARGVGAVLWSQPVAGPATFQIFDARGRSIGRSVVPEVPAGEHATSWGFLFRERELPVGVYLIGVTRGDESTEWGRVVIVR